MAPSDLRLRRHADFQLVYKSARKQYAKEISFFFARRAPEDVSGTPVFLDGAGLGVLPPGASSPNLLSEPRNGPRIGLTVGKILGKAHDRNRIKRRLRSAIRLHAGLLAGAPVDVVLHPRRTVLTLEWARLEAEVAQIFRTIHKLFKTGPQSPPAASPSGAKADSSRSRRGRTSPVAGATPAAGDRRQAGSGQPRDAERNPEQLPPPAL